MKDFLQGRPSVTPTRSAVSNINLASNLPPISNHAITVEEEPPAPFEETPPPFVQETAPSAPQHIFEEPRVELIPDSEGRVGHIVVTCRCGEVVTLQCNY